MKKQLKVNILIKSRVYKTDACGWLLTVRIVGNISFLSEI